MRREELIDLPPVVDVPTAGQVLGIGRSCAYELVRSGQWPTPVLHLGRLIRIPTAPLIALVGARREQEEHVGAGSATR
jgi:predicted DNA-binding transcriptional regulator AlpA